MKEQDINFLSSLYNTLSLVNTKGEDTIIMGECLKQLRDFMSIKSEELKAANSQEE